MKLLSSLVLLTSISALASTTHQPAPMLSTEIASCVNNTDELTIQLLSDPSVDPKKTIATFIEFKRNGETVYSSSSFNEPVQIHKNRYLYTVKGNGTETDKTLTFSWGRKGFSAQLNNLFSFDCRIN